MPVSHGFESHSCLKHYAMSRTDSANAFSLEDRHLSLEKVIRISQYFGKVALRFSCLCWKIPYLGSGEAGGPWTSGYCHGT